MSRYHWQIFALTLAVALPACPPPPDVPTRPAEKLARVEVQINNSATQSDDYIGTATPTPARIRLLNVSDPPVDVPVTLKNVDFQAAPSLVFGTGATPTAATVDLTVPGNGAWLPFVVAGGAGAASARDKDAVIEILERRADGIVVGRKSLMVTPAPPIPASATDVDLQLGGLETIDDYVTWRPVRARVRLSTGSGATSDVRVTLRNLSPVTAGRVVFGPVPALATTVQPPTMTTTLSLTLPASEQWVEFFVAGDFSHPSRNDKDAVVEVVRASDGQLLGREGLMVRIRKNANGLTANERDRFVYVVYAVARLNLGLGNYLTYQQIHANADFPTYPGHQGPAFLAWHRAYILRYERELQAIDPAVALHYWRFDQAAPTVFATTFMGGPPNAVGNATFDPSNPLAVWTIEAFSNIPREPRFSPTQSPTAFGLLPELQTLDLGGPGATYAAFRTMEDNPHGWSHGLAGFFGGWIGFVDEAVRDPLFFLLHSNVERLWAKWQWVAVRQDPAVAATYAPQGAYAGTGTIRLGHYVEDQMWPWDGRTGFVAPGDPFTQRPATAPGGPLPAPIGGWGPPGMPRPRDVVDYDRWTLLGVSGLGYGYDDVPFVF